MSHLSAGISAHSRAGFLLRRLLSVALFAALLVGMFAQSAQAQTTYVITDGSTVLVHTSSSTDPTAVLLEAGISLGESDTITMQQSGENTEIVIRRAQLVSIQYGSDLMMVGSYGETVGEILARNGIVLTDSDRIDRTLTEQTYDGMIINITRTRYETETIEETIPFETIVYEDATLPDGDQIILTEGSSGTVRTTYQICYENDVEISRTVTAQDVLSEAVDEVILQGPGRSLDDHNFHLSASDAIDYAPAASASGSTGSGSTGSSGGSAVSSAAGSSDSNASYSGASFDGTTVTTVSGEVLTVTKMLSCEATAYTCVGYTGTTATGTTARVGAIAVDPSFIPLGTRLYVVTDDGQYIYGYCTAEDTGGAIKGNIIDLYFNTWDECIQFGQRACTVYVLA